MRNGRGDQEDAPNGSQVQSVDRALSILEILARHGELGVTEIAGELDVHKSTAFRLISALEAHRLVEQLGERGKYQLGFGVIRLAGATTARMSLPREGKQVCRRLAGELGETVNIAVLDGDAIINIAQEQGSSSITAQNWVGRRTAPHATSSGKVLLAWAEDDELATVLDHGLARFTEHTITLNAMLNTQLMQVRELGWAYTTEELEIGLNAVAAPIRDSGGSVVGAITVSGPSYRLSAESFHEVAEKIMAGGAEISRRLGFHPAS